MKNISTALILAGGKGTRFSEYTKSIPKPMILIKNYPLLIQIINIYSSQGIKNFIILTGYKSEVITRYFKANYKKVAENKFIIDKSITVEIFFTGIDTQTGGRVKKVLPFIDEEMFYLTYGDGVANINIKKLTNFHLRNETIATLTAVRPPARFGSLEIANNDYVKTFGEKNNSKEGWINGGFFIINKSIDKYIKNTSEPLERSPLEKLAKLGQLKAFKHSGYWRPVDTIREKEILENEIEKKIFKYAR